MTNKKKITIGIVFGGPSAEHEVSLAATESILEAFDQLEEYDVLPIGIDKANKWHTGEGAWPTLVDMADKDMLFVRNRDVSGVAKTYGTLHPPSDCIDSCDYIMIAVIGKFGEDGSLQGFFNTLGKQIIGCDVLASALCFDKALVKAVVENYGYSVVPGADVKLNETKITSELYKKICADLETEKLVLKPTDNGSSIGLSQSENYA